MTRPLRTLVRRQPVPRTIWAYLLLAGAGLALLGVLILTTGASVRKSADFRQFLTRTDYPAFLTGARLVATGQGPRLYDPATQKLVQATILAPYSFPLGELLPYNHLPFLAVALAPMAGWSLEAGYAAWLGATGLALLGALGLLAGELRAGARTPIEARWAPRAFWALSLGFFPVYQDLLQVQTAPWDLLGYTLLVRYLRQGREVAAGLALGLALVKPQLLVVPVLVLLYTRRWRVLGAFAALGASLSLLVTPLLGGFGWVGSYLRLLGNVAAATEDTSTVQPVLMENLRGFFTLLATRYDPAAGEAAGIVALTALASLAVLGWLAWIWRGPRAALSGADPAGWDARWAATFLATLIVSPHTLPYEMVLWLLPGVLAWRAARPAEAPQSVPVTVGLLAAGYSAGTLSLVLLSIPGWSLHLGVLVASVAIVLLGARRGEGAA